MLNPQSNTAVQARITWQAPWSRTGDRAHIGQSEMNIEIGIQEEMLQRKDSVGEPTTAKQIDQWRLTAGELSWLRL